MSNIVLLSSLDLVLDSKAKVLGWEFFSQAVLEDITHFKTFIERLYGLEHREIPENTELCFDFYDLGVSLLSPKFFNLQYREENQIDKVYARAVYYAELFINHIKGYLNGEDLTNSKLEILFFGEELNVYAVSK